MVQVGAVAVAREALRLAAEVAAGRANAEHVRAVMTGCLNIPETNALALLTAPPVSRAEVLREVLDALGTLSVSYSREAGAFTLCMDSPRNEVPLLRVRGLSENDAGHAERAARAAFSAAQDIVYGMVKKAATPELPDPRWLHRYALVHGMMSLREAEEMDLGVLVERVREHMKANPEPGAYARAVEEKRAAFALAGQEDTPGPVFPMPGSTLPNAPLVLVTHLRSWMDGTVDRTEVDVRIEGQYTPALGDSLGEAANANGWSVMASEEKGDWWTAVLRKKTPKPTWAEKVNPLELRPSDIAGARVSTWDKTTGRLTLLLKDASPKALADVGDALMRYGFHLNSGSLKKDPPHITRGVELGGELTDVIHNQTWTVEAQGPKA